MLRGQLWGHEGSPDRGRAPPCWATTKPRTQSENVSVKVLWKEPDGAVPFGFAASGALLGKGSKTPCAQQAASARPTSAILSRRSPSAVKAWLGLVKQIYLDWFLTKIPSGTQMNTRLHNMCSRGDKRPAWPCEARCPHPLLWGAQPSVRTQRDLRQRALLLLSEWRPICISPNQRGARHHEPLTERRTPALHLSLGEGRRRPGPPWGIQSPRPSPWQEPRRASPGTTAGGADQWIRKTPLQNASL